MFLHIGGGAIADICMCLSRDKPVVDLTAIYVSNTTCENVIKGQCVGFSGYENISISYVRETHR